MKILKRYIQSAISPNQQYFDDVETGVAYKVFVIEDGKLKPPMVANPGNSNTPMGVWLDAEAGEFVELKGLKRVVKRGSDRQKLLDRIANLDNLEGDAYKDEIKRLKSATLAYRPGWHLGDVPRGKQFDRDASWELLDTLPKNAVLTGGTRDENTLAKKATPSNIGKYYYIKTLGVYAHIIGKGKYLPYNFVWAKCSYIMRINYQDEATEQGHMRHRADGTFYRSSEYQHSLAGLKTVPKDGYYRYRTNPRIDTVPWVITGAMRVDELLGDDEVNAILVQNGVAPIHRQGGDKTLAELMETL